MSDQQDPRATGRSGDDPVPGTTDRPPFADDSGPVDRPRTGELPDAGGDRTTQLPAVSDPDGTRVVPPAADATVVTPRPAGLDATSIMPPLDLPDAGRAEAAARTAAGQVGPESDVWTARAQVRAPRPGHGGDYTPTDWVPTPAGPQRAWWLPIAIGIAVLVLLAALGTGIWLIARGSEEPSPTAPAPVPSAPATDPESDPEPTTVRPTTTEPSPSPTTDEPTTQPSEVEVPAVIGQSSQDARAALDRVGLAYRLVFRPSSTAEEGTVIDSDPGEGREVPADTEVTLVIASAAEPSPSGTTATPGDEEPPDEE